MSKGVSRGDFFSSNESWSEYGGTEAGDLSDSCGLTSVHVHFYDTIFDGCTDFLLRRARSAVEHKEAGNF